MGMNNLLLFSRHWSFPLRFHLLYEHSNIYSFVCQADSQIPIKFFLATNTYYADTVDAASGWVLDELEAGKEAPPASPLESITPDPGGFVNILVLDMDAYAEKNHINSHRCFRIR